jgi:hypothetical protein
MLMHLGFSFGFIFQALRPTASSRLQTIHC